MAQVELDGMFLVCETVSQRQRILRAALVNGRIFQVVFLALQCGGKQLRAQA